MIRAPRKTALWYAAMIHRISGVALALFLPLHFLVLGLAIEGEAALDGFLIWAELPIVKIAEFGLVFLLSVHLFGGLRVMALEFLPWSPRQKTYAAAAVGASFMAGVGFLLSAAS